MSALVTDAKPLAEIVEEIVVDPLIDLASEIRKEIYESRNALLHAKRAGELLIKAKKKVFDDHGHGHWGRWLADYCNVGETTAEGYMRIAERWAELQAKAQRVADDDQPAPVGDAVEPEPADVVIGDLPVPAENNQPSEHAPAVNPPTPAAQHFKHAAVVAGLQKMAREVETLTADEAAGAMGALLELRSAVEDAIARALGKDGGA